MDILKKIDGTYEREIIGEMDLIYREIEAEQNLWREKCGFDCAAGCGQCCVGFEPDILDSEALFLASWILENQEEKAMSILDGSFVPKRSGEYKGCILFDESSPYHCTVYGGRCCICRLFGYSGDRGKDGKKRFKPCKFYPENTPLVFERRQYEENELFSKFAALPPAFSDTMEKVIAISPEHTETKPLRQALLEAIKRLLFLSQFGGQ